MQVSKHELGDNEGLTALRVMYELNPEGVVFTHADEGRVLAANPAACAILGMTEEEILRRGRDGIWDPDDARWFLGHEIVQRTGQVVGSVRVRQGDGAVIEVEVDAHHFTGADGLKWGCVIFRDVTTQVDAEVRVAELTQRLEQLSVGDELTGVTNRRGLAVAGADLLDCGRPAGLRRAGSLRGRARPVRPQRAARPRGRRRRPPSGGPGPARHLPPLRRGGPHRRDALCRARPRPVARTSATAWRNASWNT